MAPGWQKTEEQGSTAPTKSGQSQTKFLPHTGQSYRFLKKLIQNLKWRQTGRKPRSKVALLQRNQANLKRFFPNPTLAALPMKASYSFYFTFRSLVVCKKTIFHCHARTIISCFQICVWDSMVSIVLGVTVSYTMCPSSNNKHVSQKD